MLTPYGITGSSMKKGFSQQISERESPPNEGMKENKWISISENKVIGCQLKE